MEYSALTILKSFAYIFNPIWRWELTYLKFWARAHRRYTPCGYCAAMAFLPPLYMRSRVPLCWLVSCSLYVGSSLVCGAGMVGLHKCRGEGQTWRLYQKNYTLWISSNLRSLCRGDVCAGCQQPVQSSQVGPWSRAPRPPTPTPLSWTLPSATPSQLFAAR